MSTIALASNPADSDAFDAIEQDHAELVGGLALRTATLLAEVRGGRGWLQARDALAGWCRAELLPHAEAEEAVLYLAARRLPGLQQLIQGMSHEHVLLGELVSRLETAEDAPDAVLHAGAMQTLFEAHVAKENDLVLPTMLAAQECSVAALLAAMRTMLESQRVEGGVVGSTDAEREEPAGSHGGHACGCHDEVVAVPELDARTIPHAIRHATIFGALGGIAPGEALVLVAPHDPLPLLAQIEQRWPAGFEVGYLERGPEAWRLRFTRTLVDAARR